MGTDFGSLVGVGAFVGETAQGTAPAPAKLTFTLTSPDSYDWNANGKSSGGINSTEFNPDARLSFSIGITNRLMFASSLDSSLDNFSRNSSSNSDALAGKFRIQQTTGSTDQTFQPFLQVAPKLSFASGFGSETGRTIDYSLGFDKAWLYRYNWVRIAPEVNGSRATVWSLGLTGQVARRSSNTGADSWAASVNPNISYNILNTIDRDPKFAGGGLSVNASLSLTIAERWTDAVAGVRYRSTTANPVLTVAISPPASLYNNDPNEPKTGEDLEAKWGAPDIEFQLAFNDVASTKPDSSYSQTTFGPSIKANWKF